MPSSFGSAGAFPGSGSRVDSRPDVATTCPSSTVSSPIASTHSREYVERTRRSALVFNTPAVHECLGWKLGEFLALGKAIVSLPLTRALPAPLEHGTHLHLVDGSPESITDAIERITGDDGYRRRLEEHARAWYDEWLDPTRLVQRLTGH